MEVVSKVHPDKIPILKGFLDIFKKVKFNLPVVCCDGSEALDARRVVPEIVNQ